MTEINRHPVDNNNSSELKDLATAILEYYNCDKIIESYLNNQNNAPLQLTGCLVYKKSFEEWKNKIYYEKIDKMLFPNYNFKDKEKKKLIFIQIISFLIAKNISENYFNLIKIYNFKYLKELYELIQTEPLIFITNDFVNILKIKTKIPFLRFTFTKGIIEIDPNYPLIYTNTNLLYLKEQNNVINSQNIFLNNNPGTNINAVKAKEKINGNISNSININMQNPQEETKINLLIKLFYCQELIQQKFSTSSILRLNICMMKKELIEILKDFYGYNHIYSILKQKYIINNLLINNFMQSNYNEIKSIYLNLKLKQNNDNIINIGQIEPFSFSQKKIKGKALNYITNFEFAPTDLIKYLYFLNKNKFFNNYYFSGDLIITNKKIIITIKTKNKYLYEVGVLNNNTFIAEYILEFNKNIDISKSTDLNLNDFIKNIYNKNNDNIIYLENNIYCHIYSLLDEFPKNNEEPRDNTENKGINQNISGNNNISSLIIQSLFSISKLEKFLKYCIENQNLYFLEKYYIINKDFLIKYKEIFKSLNQDIINNTHDHTDYNNIINKIYNNHAEFFNNFFTKGKEQLFDLFKDENFLNPNLTQYKYNNNFFYYINSFGIINNETYDLLINISKFFNAKITQGGIQNTSDFIINNHKIIINHPNLFYLLIANNNINKKEYYNILFDTELIYYYANEIEKENQFELFKKSILDYEKKDEKVKGQIIFVNSKNNSLIKSQNLEVNKKIDQSIQSDFKQYLKILILFFKTNQLIKLYQENESKNKSNIIKERYYLFNENWIKEFKSLFYYEQIFPVLSKYKDIIMNSNYTDEQIIEYIYKDHNLSCLLNCQKRNINIKLSDDNLNQTFKSLKINKNNIYYFKTCAIINKNILQLFNDIKINLNTNLMLKNLNIPEAECIFCDKKIFIILSFNQEIIIKIGVFGVNDLFITQKVIYSLSPNNYSIIENSIQKFGYEYIKNLCSQNEANHFENIIFIKISKLLTYNISGQNAMINDKLKTLILLYIQQIKQLQNIELLNQLTNNSLYEKVFLININWLKEIGYYKIQNELNNNAKIQQYILRQNLINEKGENILSKIITIIPNLNILFSVGNTNSDNFYPKKEQIDNHKNIVIYKDFIIVKEKLLRLFIQNFNINKENIMILDFILLKNHNIILKINEEKQYIIFVGQIINKNLNNVKNEIINCNLFKSEYIFNYVQEYYLNQELNEIIKDYKKYILNKTTFKENEQNINISPIYGNQNLIIGYCYKNIKIKDSVNNSNHIVLNKNNNINDEVNQNLFKSILIYINDKKLKDKLKQEYYKMENEKFCLVNANWLNNLKKINGYEIIKEELKNNKKINDIIKNEKLDLNTANQILKQLSKENKLKNLNNLNEKEKQGIDVNLIPDITCKNYYDSNQNQKQIMIYNNFEISYIKFIEIMGLGKLIEKYFSECYISDNYILINFLKSPNLNNEIVSMIGILNNNNNFVPKYILIYIDERKRSEHVKKIKTNLKYFLNNLYSPIKNSSPIINDKYKCDIIGTIVHLEENIGVGGEESDEEYNLNYQTNEPFIANHFKKCPNIGLENIGATCYMNATLQCFCHIEKFVNFFKYNKQVINLVKSDKNNLTASFKLLIEKLWPLHFSNNYYSPEEFKNKISKMNPLFKGVAANDAKDLVNFIILTLHGELNKGDNNPMVNNGLIDQRNKELVFNIFSKNFLSKNKSFISDIFYSTNCTITECLKCHTKLYNYQIYFFIVFPLEEVRKFKLQFNQFGMNNNSVSIYDCFDFDRKKSVMAGSNAMYCNYCKINYDGAMFTYLVTGPEILILLLNRGKGIEFNVKIDFCEILDLNNYIEYKNTGYKYRLIGVITHIGESGMSGHFIAYCLDPINKQKWYKYNDALVNEVNNFQKEVINFAMPYLLFYQKIL